MGHTKGPEPTLSDPMFAVLPSKLYGRPTPRVYPRPLEHTDTSA